MTQDFDRVTPPGQEGQITVTLDTRKFKTTISKSVTVMTNDPRNPKVVLTMKADVQLTVEVKPRDRINIRVYDGESQTVSRAVVFRENLDYTILDARSDSELFSIEWEPYRPAAQTGTESADGDPSETADSPPVGNVDALLFEGPGKKYLIRVTISPDAPVGYHRGKITISTNNPSEPNLVLQVIARVEGRISFNPQWVYFGSITTGISATVEQRLELRSHQGTPFRVTGVDCGEHPVQAEILPLDDDMGTDLLFRWDGSAEPGVVKGKFRVTTDSKSQPELIIPFSLNVLEPKSVGDDGEGAVHGAD